MSTVHPWDLNPALREERLLSLAKIAVETRNKAFAEANRDEGDTNWGLACKAHERLGHALTRAAEEHPWLQVNREGLYLMPLVEGTPIRIYRGAPDRPASRHLDAARTEYERNKPKQTTFSFMDFAAPEDGPWYWLLALDTDLEGIVLRAVYYQANDAGETRHRWEVPLAEAGAGAPVALGEAREPAEVPPPVVTLVGQRAPRGRRLRVAQAVP